MARRKRKDYIGERLFLNGSGYFACIDVIRDVIIRCNNDS